MTTYTAEALFTAESLVQPDYHPRATIDERFAQFHAANPWIYRRLERLTADKLASGRKRLRINYLIEIVRDDFEGAHEDSAERWAVNHDYRALYSRLLMSRHPEWDGVFQVRERKSLAGAA